MKNADKGDLDAITSQLNGKKLRIGIVQARWNAGVTDSLAEACLGELMQLGVKANDFDVLASNALKDACGFTNPKQASHEEIVAIFRAAM